MANLTYRAERALLGALLRDPGQLDDVAFLNADDFASQTHRDIFTAIPRAHAAQSDGTAPLFGAAVALTAPGPGIDASYLEEMARTCPQPAHAPTYARMVAEASLRRQLAVHAERLFRDAGNLHYDIGRLSQAVRAADTTTDIPAHLLKLAHAMWLHARDFGPGGPGSPAVPATAPDPEPGPGIAPGSPVVPAAGAAWDAAAATHAAQDGEQERQEEEVLAGLIQYHWQNAQVLEWLSPAAFAPGSHRDIYEAIRTLIGNGEPVDELTIDWQLARDRVAAVGPAGEDPGAAERRGPEPGYVAVLAALPVTDGTATLTGRDLLSRYIATQLSRDGAVRVHNAGSVAPEQARPGASQQPGSPAGPGQPGVNGEHPQDPGVVIQRHAPRSSGSWPGNAPSVRPPLPGPPSETVRQPGQQGHAPRP